jgi:hypothetical protein
MKPHRELLVFVLAACCMFFVACAPGANEAIDTLGDRGSVAGFWLGLWHGMIAPIAFVISLFTTHVRVYEVHNNGSWYDFGYLLGLCCSLGGGGHTSSRRWSRRNR